MTGVFQQPADLPRSPVDRWRELAEVAGVFLRLGLTSFGGPAAHTAMMHNEVVRRRRWLGDEEFLDLVAATNLMPGPNSTELAIHLGRRRAGWPGLIAGGVSFILPAILIVLALSEVYVRYGSTPQVAALLYGIKPAVIAILAQALSHLGRRALRDMTSAVVAVAALGLWALGVNEILILLSAGFAVLLIAGRSRPKPASLGGIFPPLAIATAPATFSLPLLFLTFVKIGAVLFGSGYVLFAFLQADFVDRLGWLTQQQLLDAIVVGQVTPGPLFTSATFVGYVLGGTPGAIVASVGIFLPAFVFAALADPLLPRRRRSPWARGFLDGVVAASLGLMSGVTIGLGRAALFDLPTLLIGVAALLVLVRTKVNPSWVIVAGALAGRLAQTL